MPDFEYILKRVQKKGTAWMPERKWQTWYGNIFVVLDEVAIGKEKWLKVGLLQMEVAE